MGFEEFVKLHQTASKLLCILIVVGHFPWMGPSSFHQVIKAIQPPLRLLRTVVTVHCYLQKDAKVLCNLSVDRSSVAT